MKRQPSMDRVAPTYEHARTYTRQHARSFYFASHVLPRKKRNDAYAVYAFCRLADNIVDDNRSQAAESLKGLRNQLNDIYAGAGPSYLKAFEETVHRCEIPREYFLDLFRGLETDLVKNRYDSFEELDDYCYCVASVVGLIMARIFGVTDSAALRHARDLGTAMQLTNILRDIGEDADRGRIYLPLSDLQAFDVAEEDILKGIVTPAFRTLIAVQIDRARQYYRSGEKGFDYLPNDGSRYCVQLMSGTYGRILGRIEHQQYDVFRRRAVVPVWEKLRVAVHPSSALPAQPAGKRGRL